MSGRPQTRTYRGATLDELLPQIREELGDQAVITRQRDGVIGGVGGFFGKRCVEVEARAGAPTTPNVSLSASAAPTAPHAPQPSLQETSATSPPPVLAAHSIVDLYDDAESLDAPGWHDWPSAKSAEAQTTRPAWASTGDEAVPVKNGRFVETLLEQSLPFASHLATAEENVIASVNSDRIPEQVTARISMGDSKLPALLADSLLREVTTHVEPFSSTVSLLELLRRAIASEIRVRRGWWGPRRTIALIGTKGAGKTLTAARLCRAYASETMLSVSALSLEPGREGLELAQLTDSAEINFSIAETPAELRGAKRKLEREELVVADTPAFDPADPQSITRLCCLLDALDPDETHLVVPAASDERQTKRLLESVSESTDCLVISHADETPTPPGALVGLGITTGTPFSYVSTGRTLDRSLEPADPTRLAHLVLP